MKVDLSHTDQNSSSKPFESVDKETQMAAMQMISDYGFSNKVLLQEDLFPYLQKQKEDEIFLMTPIIKEFNLSK